MIYRIFVEPEKIVGVGLPAIALAKAGMVKNSFLELSL